MQDLALGLVELHEVCTGPLLKPVKVPLDGTSLPSSVLTCSSLQVGFESVSGEKGSRWSLFILKFSLMLTVLSVLSGHNK